MDPKQAAKAFSPDAELGDRLPSGENDVYRIHLPAGPAILRLTPEAHRSRTELESELDFVRYLAGAGYPAASPIPSTRDQYLLPVEGGHAAVFQVAPGEHVQAFGPLWTESLFKRWGRSIGRLHRLSSTYHHADRRCAWHEERTARWMPDNLHGVPAESYRRVLAGLHSAAREEMILIHGDFGRVNFHLHEDRLVVFDFDDCMRHIPMADVAFALWPLRNRPRAERRSYLSWMLEGYAKERAVNPDHFQPLVEWRTLYMLAHHERKWGAAKTERQQAWIAGLVEELQAPPAW